MRSTERDVFIEVSPSISSIQGKSPSQVVDSSCTTFQISTTLENFETSSSSDDNQIRSQQKKTAFDQADLIRQSKRIRKPSRSLLESRAHMK